MEWREPRWILLSDSPAGASMTGGATIRADVDLHKKSRGRLKNFLHRLHKVVRIKWLGRVVVNPPAPSLKEVGLRAPRCEDDSVAETSVLELIDKVPPRDAPQHEVENDQVVATVG